VGEGWLSGGALDLGLQNPGFKLKGEGKSCFGLRTFSAHGKRYNYSSHNVSLQPEDLPSDTAPL